MKNINQFDVLILGTGPAGCAAAITFKNRGYSVAIIDSSKKLNFQAGENIQGGIKDLFFKLKFDESSLNNFHLPAYETVSLWDSQLPIFKDSLFNANGHGWHLDKKKFNEQLLAKCLDVGVQLIHCSDLKIERQQLLGWEISCFVNSVPRILKSAFLIDCTGRNRVLLKKLAIPILKHDSLIAINAIYDVNLETPPMTSVIETAENGWWYSAALPGNKRVVTFFTNAKSTSFKNLTKYHNFHHQMYLTELINPYLGHLSIDKELPLTIRYANSEISSSFFGRDWICAGDAAATFDPLSSHGIETALRMGIEAADAVSDLMGSNTKVKLDQFSMNYQDMYSAYLLQRKKFYAQVQKWPRSPFWVSNTDISNS
jgi:flavin-dependent dehydrogenase